MRVRRILAAVAAFSSILLLAAETDRFVRATVEREYDFDAFSNPGKSWKDITEKIGETYPGLTGTHLLLPTNSTGEIQISSGKERGTLVMPGFDDFSELTLSMTARRHTLPDEAKTVTVGWISPSGAETNDFASIELDTMMTESSVSLSAVPPGSSIVLNNGGKKTKHRVIVDRLAFIRRHVPKPGLFIRIR